MKLGRNLSLNAIQLILNQLFGLVIFYLLSAGLAKADFGKLNLVLAILLAVFNILSLGIDQLVVKKIASGADIQSTLSLYSFHVLLTGLSFYGVLLICKLLFPATDTYCLILFIGAGKLMIYLSTPFKQVASGMEQFKLVAYMSVVSNLVRCICLLFFAVLHSISLKVTLIIFIAGDLGEFLACVYLFRATVGSGLMLKWDKPGYVKLLREALPQTGVVVITSTLARFDWIFIGFIVSAIKLAEYSFAYKVFEMATFPMLAIAPLLLPRFTKLFRQQQIVPADLKFLIRIELIIATLSSLLLNICWSPLIDLVTSGKYGTVNVKTIFILSLCMPLLYLNNFLWTINFAQGRLKMIFHSFLLTLMVNVAGDLILIPLYHNEGAAFAFLLSCLAQVIFYLWKNEIEELNTIYWNLIVCTGCAVLSGYLAIVLMLAPVMELLFSVLFFIILLFVTRQIRLNDRAGLRAILNW